MGHMYGVSRWNWANHKTLEGSIYGAAIWFVAYEVLIFMWY